MAWDLLRIFPVDKLKKIDETIREGFYEKDMQE